MISPFKVGQLIEVRAYKWPRRPTGIAQARYLGQDEHGIWLGVRRGDSFWGPDEQLAGTFKQSLVKVIPEGTYWTACFQDIDPPIDVDIVYPVSWMGDALEEVDLELDVLRFVDGWVQVRDRDKFEQLRTRWAVPDDIVERAELACAMIRQQVEAGQEPFENVGSTWLARLLAM